MSASERHEIVALDGLRAIAVLLVVVYHGVTELAPNGFAGTGGNVLLSFGPYGVTLFFVISGYVIWRPIAVAISERRTPPTPGAFAARRLVRILPALWLAIVIQSWWIEESVLRSAADWWLNLTLAQSLRHGWELSGIGVAWTLTIEAMFYVLVAAVLLALRNPNIARAAPRLEPILIVGLLATGWLVRSGFVLILDTPTSALGTWFGASAVPLTLAWWCDPFALGMAIATLHARAGGVLVSRHRRWVGWIVTGSVGGLVALDATGWARTVSEPVTQLGLLAAVPIRSLVGAGIVFALVERRSDAPRVVRARSLVWIGTISYGVYLWHLAVLRWVRDLDGVPDSALVRFAIALVGSVVLGATSWYALERPLLGAVRRAQRRTGALTPTSDSG